MQREIYHSPSAFDEIGLEWNELLARTAFNAPFMTREWQSTWWRCLGEGDLLILAWRMDGQLVGLAPLYRHEQAGRMTFSLVGCVEVSDYLDILVEPGYESQVYADLLDWLRSPSAPGWDVLDLCNLPPPSQTYTHLKELAAQQEFNVRAAQEDVCPVVPLPGTWNAYLESLDKKQRHEVRRKLRRAQEYSEPVRWRLVGAEHDLADEIDAFIDLHIRSRSDKQDFMTDAMQAFFHQAGQAMAQRGWLQLWFLMVGEQRAATMLCFDYANAVWVYNSGYDPGQFADVSPGIILTAGIIRQAIELGRSRVDFLQGNEAYKYRFGGQDTLVYRLWIER